MNLFPLDVLACRFDNKFVPSVHKKRAFRRVGTSYLYHAFFQNCAIKTFLFIPYKIYLNINKLTSSFKF